jgi:hypothetical protein
MKKKRLPRRAVEEIYALLGRGWGREASILLDLSAYLVRRKLDPFPVTRRLVENGDLTDMDDIKLSMCAEAIPVPEAKITALRTIVRRVRAEEEERCPTR